MTEAKKKFLKIFLPILAGLLAALITAGCLYLFLPGSWQSIDEFEEYRGILDFPIEEITIHFSPAEEVTFSDEDLIAQWQEGLEQLQLKKSGVQWYKIIPIPVSGDQMQVDIRTATGEYTITTYEDYSVFLSVFYYTINDPRNYPVRFTYYEACVRQGRDMPTWPQRDEWAGDSQ